MQQERFFQKEFAKDLKKFKQVEELGKSMGEPVDGRLSHGG